MKPNLETAAILLLACSLGAFLLRVPGGDFLAPAGIFVSSLYYFASAWLPDRLTMDERPKLPVRATYGIWAGLLLVGLAAKFLLVDLHWRIYYTALPATFFALMAFGMYQVYLGRHLAFFQRALARTVLLGMLAYTLYLTPSEKLARYAETERLAAPAAPSQSAD